MKMQDLVYKEQNTKCGNHKMEIVGGVKNLIYYTTTICKVNSHLKVFGIDSSYGTQSTKRACNQYKRELEDNGYIEIAFNDARLV